jgi:hypothetical protein
MYYKLNELRVSGVTKVYFPKSRIQKHSKFTSAERRLVKSIAATLTTFSILLFSSTPENNAENLCLLKIVKWILRTDRDKEVLAEYIAMALILTKP